MPGASPAVSFAARHLVVPQPMTVAVRLIHLSLDWSRLISCVSVGAHGASSSSVRTATSFWYVCSLNEGWSTTRATPMLREQTCSVLAESASEYRWTPTTYGKSSDGSWLKQCAAVSTTREVMSEPPHTTCPLPAKPTKSTT
eukprot:1868415-Pleurochrysis_carterae.AAC.2